jgi:hypothetical protein
MIRALAERAVGAAALTLALAAAAAAQDTNH